MARRAGLEDWHRITPHKLRHSYASALVEAGRGINEVKELLGHSSISTTQVYVHVSQRRLEEAARTMPDVIGCPSIRRLEQGARSPFPQASSVKRWRT
ncbi:tyrosine-type recombinase/integrase [Marinithermus hydrothermalis]|uniref:tyrosine-type recombinase/integrase n=1 Tax=Marinithermus hydrothermalis TaxID=186192 RepID=UPI0003096CAA|nr:tyrosine-type recombinase/integrase [Marinithermus hydrothermalis]